jgi:hypothetical protein
MLANVSWRKREYLNEYESEQLDFHVLPKKIKAAQRPRKEEEKRVGWGRRIRTLTIRTRILAHHLVIQSDYER